MKKRLLAVALVAFAASACGSGDRSKRPKGDTEAGVDAGRDAMVLDAAPPTPDAALDAREEGATPPLPPPDAGGDAPADAPAAETVLAITSSGAGAGTVTSTPEGVACGGQCTATFPSDTTVTLVAAASPGSVFAGWDGLCSGQGETCTVVLDAPSVGIGAVFELQAQPILSVTVAGGGQGRVVADAGDIDCPGSCSGTFAPDAQVTLTAIPDAASDFAGWTGACNGTEPVCSVTVAEAASVEARFEPRRYTLELATSGGGEGTLVLTAPAGTPCDGTCTLDHGTEVTLRATPGTGSVFLGWGGDACSGTDPTCTFTLDANHLVDAVFSTEIFGVIVTRTGTGTGQVASTPTGIACAPTCTAGYDYGETVVLTATPATGSTFGAWTGCDSASGRDCTLAVDAARNVSARFDVQSYPVQVEKTGTGTGTVSADAGAITCGATCSDTYDHGAQIALTAVPGASSTFTGWEGCPDAQGAICRVTVTSAATVRATFALVARALTVAAAGTGSGTVSSAPAGIACGTDCSEDYDHGTSVVLTAAPASGSTFTGWTGCPSASGPVCTAPMTATRNVTATFALESFPLTVSRAGTGSGQVTSSPAGISCGADCSETLDFGTTVALTAAASPGSTFTGWTGCPSATGATCTVTLTAARAVTALFTLETRALTVSRGGSGAGTVTSDAPGISCGADCSQAFDFGSTVTLTAAPTAGSTFVSWTGCGTATGSSCTVTMTAARAVTATFTLNRYALTVARSGNGSGAVTSDVAGISCGADCSEDYGHGSTVVLTAAPTSGSTFSGWTSCPSAAGNACTVNVTAARTVTATFTLDSVGLSVQRAGNGSGSVTSDAPGISCGTDCSEAFDFGTTVVLTASPAAGSGFTGWTGCPSASGSTCTVTVSAARTVTAAFTLDRFALSAARAGNGSGTVSSDVAGISCGADCSEDFDYGTTVVLSAAQAAGSTFTSWTNCPSASGSTCTVNVTAALTVTATFTLNTYTLTAARSGTGSGTVSSDVAGISCGADCSESYTHGTAVVLTAAPAAGSTFTSWTNCPSASGSTCTVSVTAARTVTATFTLSSYTLAVARSGTGSGTVSSDLPGIDCGADCSEDYVHGTSVVLTAAQAAGSTFTSWTNCPSALGSTCTVSMTAARTVTATFTLNRYPLTAVRTGTGTGTITSNPAGISCGADCSEDFDHGASVVLTAAEATGSAFTSWSGCPTPSGSTCTVSVTAATTVAATFTLNRYTLDVTRAGTGSGTVSSDLPGVICGADCAEDYDHGSTVVLTAAQATGSTFTSWTNCPAATGSTCTVTMTAARSVTATFTRNSYALTAARTGTGSGTVTSAPAGITCGADCSEIFDHGTSVVLTAVPAPGSTFTSWTSCPSALGSTCTVSMTAARTVTATFTLDRHAIDVARNGSGSGTVTSSPAGISCGSDCSETFDYGTNVVLTAAATAGSTFSGWTSCPSAAGNDCTVSVTAALTVTATFTLDSIGLSVRRAGNGSGTVASDVPGISCGSDCSEAFPFGTNVVLTATEATGSTFSGWTNCPSIAGNTCTVNVTAASTVTATFTLDRYTLTAARNGTGVGTVTSSPAGISCGVDCSEDYDHGTSVVLTAAEATGSTFTSWTNCPSASGSTCTVSVTAARTVTATFTLNRYTLTAARSGTGSGTVTSSPAGISCGTDCSEAYDHGTSVVLTAAQATGSTFSSWTNCPSASGSTCTVSMTAARTVTATFTLNSYALTVARSGTGSGTVTSSPSGISCGTDCSQSYNHGTSVVLTAAPSTGSTFTSWTNCPSVSGSTCTVSMTAARTVTATFTLNRYTLTVARSGTGSGTVSSSPAGISCGTDCSQGYDHGTSVVLTAAAASGSRFGSWSGCTSTSGTTCTVSMTQARSVTATFIRRWTLTVTLDPATASSVGSGATNECVLSDCSGTTIDCRHNTGRRDCTQTYDEGSAEILAAHTGGFASYQWFGCDQVSGNLCIVNPIDSSRTLRLLLIPVQ